MSSFSAHARLYSDFDKGILPKTHTTDTEGSTYKYASTGGKRRRRSTRRHNKKRKNYTRYNRKKHYLN
jgi:hypothetical protein